MGGRERERVRFGYKMDGIARGGAKMPPAASAISLSLSLSLNGSIIEGQWERDSDLEFSGVTGAFLNLE